MKKPLLNKEIVLLFFDLLRNEGKTQIEIASDLGVNRQSVINILNGNTKKITDKMDGRLYSAYGIRLEAFAKDCLDKKEAEVRASENSLEELEKLKATIQVLATKYAAATEKIVKLENELRKYKS